MIRVEKIDDIEKFRSLKSIWNVLARKTDPENIFLTYEYMLSWWEAFGDKHHLQILQIISDDETIGLVPLMLSGDIIRFIGTPNADYCDFLGEEKKIIINEVIDYLNKHRREWNKIELSQISEKSKSLKILNQVLIERNNKFLTKKIENVSSYKYDGDDISRPDFSLKRGSSFKRFSNFFKKTNGLNYECYHDVEAITYWLKPFYQCHTTRWSGMGLPGKFLDPAMRRFHEFLTNNLAPLKKVFLAVLKHGEIPLAYLFAFTHNKTVSLYNIANESFYQRRSPGILLLHQMIEEQIRQGIEIIDFSRGGGAHKERFVNQTGYNYQITIYNRNADYYRNRLVSAVKALYPVKTAIGSDTYLNLKLKITQGIRIKKEESRAGLLWRFVKYAISPIFRYYHFNIYTHNPDNYSTDNIPIETKVDNLTADNMEMLANFYGIPENSEKHRIMVERFEHGCDCYVLFHHGRIVSIMWGLNHIDIDRESGLKIIPDHEQVVSTDAFTAELYRGMNLRSYIMSHALKEYERKGISVIGAIEGSKRSQIRAANKQKYQLLYNRRVVKMFGKSIEF